VGIIEGVVPDAQVNVEDASVPVVSTDQGAKRAADGDGMVVSELIGKKVGLHRLLAQTIGWAKSHLGLVKAR